MEHEGVCFVVLSVDWPSLGMFVLWTVVSERLAPIGFGKGIPAINETRSKQIPNVNGQIRAGLFIDVFHRPGCAKSSSCSIFPPASQMCDGITDRKT